MSRYLTMAVHLCPSSLKSGVFPLYISLIVYCFSNQRKENTESKPGIDLTKKIKSGRIKKWVKKYSLMKVSYLNLDKVMSSKAAASGWTLERMSSRYFSNSGFCFDLIILQSQVNQVWSTENAKIPGTKTNFL